MVALKLFFLTILTYVYVSNGNTITKPIELTGPEREAAVERLYTGLHKVVLAGGPVYKVLNVRKVFNIKSSGYSEDIYNTGLAVGRVPKACVVKKSIDTRSPSKPINKIKIFCNFILEFQKNY
ncbi:uncharacterized protein LOC117573847 isoform X2 [Drosophila albomicans]|uniref:Uncharacterized protein LOC117573847 isoform X2 n=1 Tax=Drosophila albomicans TaxID=7291 RepID=A0A9C6TCJ4_DROAB|nr:uncharacterized protein LOC117573847 isoform X2 [Drosophila albomicans]